MPLSRTNRMQKDLKVSWTPDTFSLAALDSILVSLDASFASAFPLSFPDNRTAGSLTKGALTSPGSCE